MSKQKSVLVETVYFVAKITKMGKKVIILIPKDFHKSLEPIMGKYMKFKAESILEDPSNGFTGSVKGTETHFETENLKTRSKK